MKQKLCYVLISLCCFVYAQNLKVNELTPESCIWKLPLEGRTICPPVMTQYGVLALTDAKSLTCITSKGKSLWKINFATRPGQEIHSISPQFILVAPSKNKLSLVNINGIILWTIDTPFIVEGDVLMTEDGRIIIRGDGNVACIGLNGVIKWSVNNSEISTSLSIKETQDGILVPLKSGKALKYSLFGEDKGKCEYPKETPNNANLELKGETFILKDSEGKEVYKAHINIEDTQPFNYYIYHDDGVLMTFSRDWVVYAYNFPSIKSSTPRTASHTISFNIDNSTYSNNYALNSISDRDKNTLLKTKLLEGNYGVEEIGIGSFLYSVTAAYERELDSGKASYGDTSVFTKDSESIGEIILLVPLLGTKTSINMIYNLMNKENYSIYLRTLLLAIRELPYDERGKLLSLIEKKLLNLPNNDVPLLCTIADTAYDIYRFTGTKEAFQGSMRILNTLLLPKYDKRVTTHAKNILSRMLSLKK